MNETLSTLDRTPAASLDFVKCEGVFKNYTQSGRDVAVLRGVDLSIREPGFFGIMGQSGSGKSTLLHLLAALDSPDSGTLTVSGRRLDQMTAAEITAFRRRDIGIVFQQFNLIPTLSARENVELPGMLAGERERDLRQRSGELLEQLGLGSRAEHRPDALSGGEQQRVAIARALLFSPPVLLADEPTGNLDSATSQRLWALLGEVAEQRRMLVLMVTHEPAAAAHCRRVFVLKDGRVISILETEGLDAAGVAARYQESVREA